MIRRFDLGRRQDPTRTRRGKFDARFERFLSQFCELTGLEGRESAVREFARFTGDPGSVSLGLVRVAEAAADNEVDLGALLRESQHLLDRLVRLAGSSEACIDHIVRWPDSLRLLARDEDFLRSQRRREVRGRIARSVYDADGQLLLGEDGRTALRRAYRDELIQLTAADLGNPEPTAVYDAVSRTLTEMAEGALIAAHDIAAAESMPDGCAELSVIAMGKCGARELNYVSDVDVVFAFSPGPTAAGEEAERARSCASSAALRIIDLISAAAAEPALWEVDAALRPEGKAGALVRTVDEFENYYSEIAENWEFQALFKARPVAGSEQLGQQWAEACLPQVWSAAHRDDFIPEVRAMRRRVVDLIDRSEADRQLKLGPGGLRDVEFSAQLLQLVHGTEDHDIREPNTLEALRSLERGGYLSGEDAAVLEEAYSFMRVVEHRLQIPRMRRAAVLPDSPEDLRELARMVYPTGDRSELRLKRERDDYSRRVRALHEQVFYRPILDAAVGSGAVRLLPEKAAESRLRAFGFVDPRSAMRHIHDLSAGVSRASRVHRQVLPAMLSWLSEGVDPDSGLLAYRRLSEQLGTSTWYLKLLRDSGQGAEALARVLSLSQYATSHIMHYHGSVRWLADQDMLQPTPLESLRQEMSELVGRGRGVPGVRAVHGREKLRIILADILEVIPRSSVPQALSDVMSAAVEAALLSVRRELDTEHRLYDYDFAIIAMGRLGGREIGVFSDADVCFVYRPANTMGDDDREALAKHARRVALGLTSALKSPQQDPAIELDADLRPEGRSGPYVRTLESYRRYYSAWSEPWEAQALLRARPIAGDEELMNDYVDMINPLRYPESLPQRSVMQVRRLKARMEDERLPRGADRRQHVKLGTGGLSDVEWTVQLLQLQHGAEFSGLRTTSTLPALRTARDEGLIGASEHEILRTAWLMATEVRNAITLHRGKPSDSLPSDIRELEAAARLMGYPQGSAQQLVDDYLRVTRWARSTMEVIFYGDDPAD
ncbi:bifunctional [glutamine synthetase] adenylyltransferase/[glutamine synthetase]-adenylyl-L-tyrosine phosphorylase [Brevibacterium sp. HMSC07C04]|uniref:bifunctional [glutamine synthetase] adenylyltransferase/[glutamine synthetase]-adenylyl-L-tyrosine phosphorylase n=1 Tax=Brevibacterium sp. HMSC07C04 TaxID=1581130 RepID=UPI0008A1A2B0|nr:bifunctional [glutamine synthetase] adenylyltransferase/[glutamine synthetase]-adenylyl-L-tyrosine phosphorylase [Brevibacterium sp. HMSC07C04]OFS26349.1 bifunctional glutamine-synthetase adenylyltransferase/deadenyltransferase [Brevibacterium sp. HMSC07C04]